mgnify:CR=1 FL=1
MGVGFIRDKLEIKFLILYIAARVSEPLPLEGMQELTMCDDGIDYFDFSECLNDLVQTEHLRLTEEGRYAITPKGLKNSAICESSLPYSVRLRTDRNIEEYNKELLRQAQVQGKAIPRENGTYTVEAQRRCGQPDAAGADGGHGGDGQGSGGAVSQGPGASLCPCAGGPVRGTEVK